MVIENYLQRIWSRRGLIAYAFWPLSVIYSAAVELRRIAYSSGLLPVERFTVPIIVVGNLTVGGTGKTPLTIWLVEFLRAKGLRPAVVSRGYGRRGKGPMVVTPERTADEVGDEPLLIYRRTGVPVAVGSQRADAIKMLMLDYECDVFISDDGLQHLAIESNLKIALIDGDERFGNGFLLPAGPLREHVKRINYVDLILVRDGKKENEMNMQHEISKAVNINNRQNVQPLKSFSNEHVTTIAGIRHPQRFFDLLAEKGIQSKNIAYPDHYGYTTRDFANLQEPGTTILMTEKDAVKCESFAASSWWCVVVDVKPDEQFIEELTSKLSEMELI